MKTILVPVDFSDTTGAVVAMARQLAVTFHSRIILIHVVAIIAGEVISLEEDPDSPARQLARIQADLERAGLKAEVRELFGPPALRIHEEALRVGADCIVIGSHGHGALYDMLIGSIAIQILKQAPCPVLVVPAERRQRSAEWVPEAAATG